MFDGKKGAEHEGRQEAYKESKGKEMSQLVALMTYHSHNCSLINLATHNLAAYQVIYGFSDSMLRRDGRNSTHPPIVSITVTS